MFSPSFISHISVFIVFISVSLTLCACQDPWRAVAQISPKPSPALAESTPSTPTKTTEKPPEISDSDEILEDTLSKDTTQAPEDQDQAVDQAVDQAEIALPTPSPQQPQQTPKRTQTQAITPPSPSAAPSSASSAASPAVACVDINSAGLSELISLPGIGPSKAEHIIKRRPFKRLRDITKVKGIGPKTLSRLQPLLCPL